MATKEAIRSTMILLPCHAVFYPAQQEDQHNVRNPANWLLNPHQTAEEVDKLIQHIALAVRLLMDEPPYEKRWLVISGGATRKDALQDGLSLTPAYPRQHVSPAAHKFVTEAASYFHAAMLLAKDMVQAADTGLDVVDKLRERTILEEYARDSMENLAYGIDVFMQHQIELPSNIYVVGWGFKAARFLDHAAALGLGTAETTNNGSVLPGTAPSMIYIDAGSPPDVEAANLGEANTRNLFHSEPFGNCGPLYEKRRRRTVVNEMPAYSGPYASKIRW